MTRTESELEAALVALTDSPLDADAILATVHRRAAVRRRRRAIGTGLATVVVIIGVSAPILVGRAETTRPTQGPTVDASPTSSPNRVFSGTCVARPLSLPPSIRDLDSNIVRHIAVDAVDASGRFIVASYSGHGSPPFVILWDRERPTLLPIHDAQVHPFGVDGRGAVVGWAWHAPSDPNLPQTVDGYAWVYADGVLSTLPTPPGYVAARAFAINERGDIAGEAVRADWRRVAVLWPADRSPVRVLDAPGNASASAITRDGRLVGFAGGMQPPPGEDVNAVVDPRPYVWAQDGTGTFLPMPNGETAGQAKQARGEWAVGHVYHESTGAGKNTYATVAVRWNLRTGEVTAIPNWDNNLFLAVNAEGDVASSGKQGATLFRGSRSFPLPGLANDTTRLPGAPPVLNPMASPVGLNDGATVVVGRYVGNTLAPVIVWDC